MVCPMFWRHVCTLWCNVNLFLPETFAKCWTLCCTFLQGRWDAEVGAGALSVFFGTQPKFIGQGALGGAIWGQSVFQTSAVQGLLNAQFSQRHALHCGGLLFLLICQWLATAGSSSTHKWEKKILLELLKQSLALVMSESSVRVGLRLLSGAFSNLWPQERVSMMLPRGKCKPTQHDEWPSKTASIFSSSDIIQLLTTCNLLALLCLNFSCFSSSDKWQIDSQICVLLLITPSRRDFFGFEQCPQFLLGTQSSDNDWHCCSGTSNVGASCKWSARSSWTDKGHLHLEALSSNCHA